MTKRTIYLFVAVLLAGVYTHAFAATLTDVRGTAFQTAFDYLSNKGVVEGYLDGTGRPYAPINRAEALKLITLSDKEISRRVSWYSKNMPPLPIFADVSQQSWYAPFVEAGFETGILKGYPDGTFRGANFVTVEEALTMLLRSRGESGDTGPALLSPYIANQSNEWFTPYINGAIEKNMVMRQQTLRLGAPITRGQFFDMVYRYMNIEDTGKSSFPKEEPRTTVVRNEGNTNNGNTNVTRNIPQQSQPTVPRSLSPHASEKYFAVSMPSIGINDLSIVHPVDPFTSKGILEPLSRGVGHLFSYPGGGGKIMVYGHSSGYPWDISQYTKIFRKVNQLKVGDRLYVTYEGKLHTYEVTHEQTIDAKDTSPFNDNGAGEELILYTCWPPDSIAQRYLVHATPVDTVALR